MFATILLTALSVATPPSDAIRQGVELSRKGDHEASEAIFQDITVGDPTLDFYRLVNAFKLNRKADVEKYAGIILEGPGEYPQRYTELALIMRVEASTWKDDADDLGDISREMGKITDRLKNQKGGAKTQEMQKEVLARLDKMIKDAEDKQKAAQDAAEKAEADARKGKIEQNPAQDTVKGQEQGPGHVSAKRVKEIADVWGKLPEKERARAMVELTRSMPAKDKAVIEAYFRELQKRSKR